MDKMRRYLIFLCLSISLAGCRTAAPAEDTLEATNTSSVAGTPATAESSSAVESSVTAETPAAADSAITFPPAGEMLKVECEPFAPLDDDGSREVTVQYYFADGTEVSASYDLSAGETRDEAEEPVITIQRDWSTGAGVMHTSAPVTAQEDRDWILDAISSADFQPMRELPGYGNLVLFVEEDGETVSYGVCSDGTLFWEDANGNVEFAAEALDYLKLSALTYKYAGRASHIGGYLPEGWLLSVQLEQRAEIPEEIAAV